MIDQYIIFGLPVATFFVGFAVGWLTRGASGGMTRSRLQLIVASVVTVIWIVSVIAEIVIQGYATPIAIHGIMGASVGYLFGGKEGIKLNLGKQ